MTIRPCPVCGCPGELTGVLTGVGAVFNTKCTECGWYYSHRKLPRIVRGAKRRGGGGQGAGPR